MQESKTVKVLVVGAGGRGSGYAAYSLNSPDQMRVVGVAEPVAERRRRMAREYSIPAENVFSDWREAAGRERLADAVLICTQDSMHTDPVLAFAARGYHILLEKPMAPTEDECRRITEAVEGAGVIFAVCHVLRYTPHTRRLKDLLDQGIIGDLVSLQHVEVVGHWHQAHSYVRGNWRNEKESSFMLLAKSCHDIDLIRYLMDRPCRRVSSFGSLHHFRSSQKPAGAADRCLDCGVEHTCPYSAVKIYLGFLARGQDKWPVNVLTDKPVNAGTIVAALREGPYGRCVYACDNDVVDHQVVNLEFAGGCSAVFTMTAFGEGGRKTRLFGTRGELYGDGGKIRHYDFLTGESRLLEVNKAADSILGGHGGGDRGIMHSFIRAVAENDPAPILSSARETLESHRMTFAAERARREGIVVAVTPAD